MPCTFPRRVLSPTRAEARLRTGPITYEIDLRYSPAGSLPIGSMGAAVTYYEQFGLAPNASPEEIHRAYRHLCRILHPDQQQQEELRVVAEAQMRWVNQVFETLRDPERRRVYDATLTGADPGPPNRFRLPRERLGWRTGLWYACAAVAVAGIAWQMSGARAGIPVTPHREALYSVVADRANGALAPSRAPESPVRGLTPVPGAARPAPPGGHFRMAMPARRPAGASPAPERISAPAVADWAASPPSLAAEPPAGWLHSGPLPPAFPVLPPRFAGTWYYVPDNRSPPADARSAPMYAPEFIHLVVSERDNLIEGHYHARYRVADRAISPSIAFRFRGTVLHDLAQVEWSGEAGAAGEAQLRFLSADRLEMKWSTTVFGDAPQLAAGRSVLVRKAPP
jgi:hypothetical protein